MDAGRYNCAKSDKKEQKRMILLRMSDEIHTLATPKPPCAVVGNM